jgi:signal transduction histidine kinase
MNGDARAHLGHPLPGEVLRSGAGLVAYRNYPVFSWPWLRGRTLLFALLVGSLGGLVGLGIYLRDQRIGPAASAFAAFTLGFLLIGTVGPLLATMVRHRRLGLRLERPLVVAALVLGLAGSFVSDQWASAALERRLAGAQVVVPPPQVRAEVMARRPLVLAVNLVMLAVVYGVLGGGLGLRSYLGEPRRLAELARARELTELRASKQILDLRLSVLQAQVEPHFLFNTLGSLRSLIVRDPASAESTLDAMVDYLRATIPRLRQEAAALDSTLGQQLEICVSYLRVMSVRMGGRLQHTTEVDPGLRAAAFPPLILMSLVENAIKHGIEPRPGPGRVVIRAERHGDRLAVSVADDGVGLRDGLGGGVGLGNVRAQLRTHYGERAALTLAGRPGGGATATIELPLSS